VKKTSTMLSVALCFLFISCLFAHDTENVSPVFMTGINDIEVIDDYVYCAYANGFIILDVSNPADPVRTGEIDIPGGTAEVSISGSYAFAAGWESGLWIIDISNPSKPTLAGSCRKPDYVCGVCCLDGYAYAACGYSGLQIIDVADPANPKLTGSINTPGYAFGVYVSGGYVYVADLDEGLQIVDISDPANPILTGNYDMQGYACDIFVAGSYAYIAGGFSGFHIIDISNPANPFLAGKNEGFYPEDIYVKDNYAYIANGALNSGLLIVDTSNPANPKLIGNLKTPEWDKGVYISDDYAYVVDCSGLYIIDKSNPANPKLVGNHITNHIEKDYSAEGDIYIPGSEEHLITDYSQDARDFVLKDNYCYATGRSGDDQWQPFLFKADTNGVEEWFYEYGPWTVYDAAYAITNTNDDGFILAGKVQPESGYSDDDILLLKVNSYGDTIWHQEHDLAGTAYNGNGFDRLWDIMELDNGDFVGCGTITERDFPFDIDIYPYSHKDAGLIKFNSLGDIIWIKYYGDTISTETARCCHQTSDGGFILTGYYDYHYVGINQLYVVKTDSSGNAEWERTYGDQDKWHIGYWVDETSDGNFIIAGEIETDQELDAWVLKISSSNGDIIWERMFGDQYIDTFRNGILTTSENMLIAGFTNANNEEHTDAWLVELDSHGNYLCEMLEGENDTSEYFIGIKGTINNKYILVGNKSEPKFPFLIMSDLSNCEAMMYYYLPGDVNMVNGIWPPTVIGGDVTFLVNYFKGSPSSNPCCMHNPSANPPAGQYFWASSDMNGDCIILGSDVIRLVNYFRGFGIIEYCEEYQPLWLSAYEANTYSEPTGWPNCNTAPLSNRIIPSDSDK